MNKLKRRFQNAKLNTKFTTVILLSMLIPVTFLVSILFSVMENNVVKENLKYMDYTVTRAGDMVLKNIDAINMSTQMFLTDETLREKLTAAVTGEEISTTEWVEFKNHTVTALERLVNNNPLLYGVRAYAENDSVQEMMPILYQKDRMLRQDWANTPDYYGWQFDFNDNVFSAYTMSQNQKIASLVTPITDGEHGQIGTIEAAMTMENMFPSLYEGMENEWSFFYTEQNLYYDDALREMDTAELERITGAVVQNGETPSSYLKHGRQHLVVASLPIQELNGSLICVKDISSNMREIYNMRVVYIIVMILLLAAIASVIDLIVNRLLRQFYEILGSIRRVQKGDLDVVIENCGNDEMGELGTQINTMLDRIKELMEENLNREMLAKNSEIRALQNQINAHFIYNVLESIKMMAEIDQEYEISDAVTALGKLLRYSMKWVNGNVRVEEELEYIRNYMSLINLRFDYEIYLSVNLPDILLRQEIPKLSLQPLIENAIKHGIEDIAEDTTIYLKGYVEGEDCIIEISDAGKGMSEEAVEKLRLKIAGKIESGGGSGNGIGLKNVQDRLHIAFGEKYGLSIESRLGCYTKIIVRVPLTCQERSDYENHINCGR